MSASSLYDIQCVLLATLIATFALALLVRMLGKTRPDFRIGTPVAMGLALRLIAVAGVSASGVSLTLRGGDELRFLAEARDIAAAGFDSGLWFPTGDHRLHQIVFALQLKVADFPDGALRVTQVGIALAGVVLVVAAIHDLSGPRAARLGAWVLALEPAGIFFNSILHREPVLVLASGLVVFGGTKVWTKLDLRGVALLGLGCAVAVATRPYAGWFLITGGLLLILHASLRQRTTTLRSLPLIYAVLIVVAAMTPAVLQLTSEKSLDKNLQGPQNANTDADSVRGGANTNNLALESVDFSSRADLLTNLPRRIRDVVLRPYPWELQNTSQQLGAIGTLVVLAALFLLFRYARLSRGGAFARAGPIFYPAFFLLIAYALSVGNAGTGFRYRTHLVLLGLAILVVLREHALRADPALEDNESREHVEDDAAAVRARRDQGSQRHALPRSTGPSWL